MVDPATKEKLIAECDGRVLNCSDRNACDLELMFIGGFSPLTGPMNHEEYEYCVDNMR